MIQISNSPAETAAIAGILALALKGGECIALNGELGAGKTCFVRGLVAALEGNVRRVSSPTFVLLNIYEGGRLVVYHLDAYRVSEDDLEAVGFAELLEQGGVVVVEWAARVRALLPDSHIDVSIEPIDEQVRQISIMPNSPTV